MTNGKSIITANGNVNFSNISGQIAIGDNIIQKQELSVNDMDELMNSLMKFQENISLLDISKTDLDLINEDLKVAISETKKEKPLISKIKDKFESAINTIKKTGRFIDTVSNWEWTENIVSLLGKVGLALVV